MVDTFSYSWDPVNASDTDICAIIKPTHAAIAAINDAGDTKLVGTEKGPDSDMFLQVLNRRNLINALTTQDPEEAAHTLQKFSNLGISISRLFSKGEVVLSKSTATVLIHPKHPNEIRPLLEKAVTGILAERNKPAHPVDKIYGWEEASGQ